MKHDENVFNGLDFNTRNIIELHRSLIYIFPRRIAYDARFRHFAIALKHRHRWNGARCECSARGLVILIMHNTATRNFTTIRMKIFLKVSLRQKAIGPTKRKRISNLMLSRQKKAPQND